MHDSKFLDSDVFGLFFCRYNEIMPSKLHLPTFGKKDTSGLIIGNTKHLWEAFTKEIQETGQFPPNPLDQYTMNCTYKS